MLEWETIGKLWIILLGGTIVFEAFKWVIEKVSK